MLPRWRTAAETSRRRELDPLESAPRDYAGAKTLFEETLRELPESAGPADISDAISAGVTLGLPSAAVPLALRLSTTAQPTRGLSLVVNHVLNRGLDIQAFSQVGLEFPDRDAVREKVREARQSLRVYPRNSLQWVDLALQLETLGSRPNAVNAMKVALAMSPDNRHVLRSAVRLYVHQHEFEAAHELLSRRTITKNDPWLLAAELAAARVTGNVSRNVKHALRMIEHERFAPFHLSEAAAAVGTLELESGQFKRGIKLIRASLESPTENAVAQASWAATKFKFDLPTSDPEQLTVTSPEANASSAFNQEDFDTSIREGMKWLRDESFSKRPAVFVSHVLALAKDDYVGAANLLQFSIQANQDDFVLRNNLAFCLAKADRVDEASQVGNSLHALATHPKDRAVAAATLGLVDFRNNLPERGREGYRLAIEQFRKLGDSRSMLTATFYWMLEEIRISPTFKENAARVIRDAKIDTDDTTNEHLRRKLAESLGLTLPPPTLQHRVDAL